MKLAFVYAGQGSQKVGMGKDFYDNFVSFKEIIDVSLNEMQKSIMFEGPEDELAKTSNTQPIMVAFAAGITELLYKAGICPEMAAGLSLGEYSALAAAGVWDAGTATDIASFRGKVMEDAVIGTDCAMSAVIGLDRDNLEAACSAVCGEYVCEIANYNCPGQLVISGHRIAVEKTCEKALEMGAKRCISLKVSGPFHTSLMKSAGDALQDKFQSIPFGEMNFPVIFNSTASPLGRDISVENMLVRQVQSSVYFEDTVRYMQEYGIDTIVEIGPGRVLSGFIKKTAPDIKVYAVEDCKSLMALLNELGGLL